MFNRKNTDVSITLTSCVNFTYHCVSQILIIYTLINIYFKLCIWAKNSFNKTKSRMRIKRTTNLVKGDQELRNVHKTGACNNCWIWTIDRIHHKWTRSCTPLDLICILNKTRRYIFNICIRVIHITPVVRFARSQLYM